MEKTKFNFDTIDDQYGLMTDKEFWLKYQHPMTVINDRYGGTYSGGNYTAFPCEYWKLPADGPDGSDIPCSLFWDRYEGYVGLGETAAEAAKDLVRCIVNGIHYQERNSFFNNIDDMREMNYEPKPVDTSGVELSKDLQMLSEMIAKNCHDVWAVGRMNDGWTFGKQRDDATKKHPCLVPYEMLTESEKEYDRNTSMETLKLITKLGYNITKI